MSISYPLTSKSIIPKIMTFVLNMSEQNVEMTVHTYMVPVLFVSISMLSVNFSYLLGNLRIKGNHQV